MPSVLQKRFAARGRSVEITRTTLLGLLPACSLKTRVDFAHTGVSRLGTMLSTLRLPAKSLSPTSLRSLPHSVKSGTVSPFFGNWPATLIGLPPSVTVAMLRLLLIGGHSIAANGNRHAQGVGAASRSSRKPAGLRSPVSRSTRTAPSGPAGRTRLH